MEVDLQAMTEYKDPVRGPDLGTGKPGTEPLQQEQSKVSCLVPDRSAGQKQDGCVVVAFTRVLSSLLYPGPEECVKPQPFCLPLATSVLNPPAQVGG